LTALLGIRLSDASMRQRPEAFTSIPASLKPPVARAMALLSAPRATDRVLDPFCGAGTLLIERARVASYAALIGGDVSPAAVRVARSNLQTAGLSADLRTWDALSLPLESGTVDVVLTNPPFGKQLAIPGGDPQAFYAGMLAELARVVVPGGVAVVITSATRALQGALRTSSGVLRVHDHVPVLVRGEPTEVVLLERAGQD
jgi:tRNA G10  N-methylase Trm11